MAQAILLDDVESLGERGAVVEVSKGYLRNYLIPRQLAQPATTGALASARQRAEAAERAAQRGPADASAWERVGRLRLRLMDRQGALEALERLRGETGLADRCRASASARFHLEDVGGARYRRLYRRLFEAPGRVAAVEVGS